MTRAARFGAVGIAATAAYFALMNLIAAPIGPASPFVAHVIALASSIWISYVGHHSFTFRLSGRHGLHVSRFTIVTIVLFLLATAFAYGCDKGLHLSALVISTLVGVLYPLASYVIHSLWTFAGGGPAQMESAAPERVG
ncbi:MAG TPA: GtrA family protein [Stellaceae bacterium]|nr:GtrA family protein [Stellaceae bacterium]